MNKVDNDLRFDASDRGIIEKALHVLLQERSRAFELATEIAKSKGNPMPNHEDFGLSAILRLARRCESGPLVETTLHATERRKVRQRPPRRRETSAPSSHVEGP